MNPLADRLRPTKISEIVGQSHLLATDKLLSKSIEGKKLFSMILWGPPGVGKTTLARVMAQEIEAEFLEFSAVTTGIAELKKIFEKLHLSRISNPKLELNSQTVIFIDEIHRFNKAQQDALLPYVENGSFILIGATTENPSFEVIGALLSRTRVLTLTQLSEDDQKSLIDRALIDTEKGLGKFKLKIAPDATALLIDLSSGDARILLNTLEIAASLAKKVIKIGDIEQAFQTKALGYDKSGEEHYNTISAFIKSMRASNPDAAVYYLSRMLVAGEDPIFIARRMVIFASEDIGMALPTALVVANEVFRAVETIGMPECAINLSHGVIYMSCAPKNRDSYDALRAAQADVMSLGNLPIPMNLRNAPTKLMKDLGYGSGYEKYSKEDLLPEKLKGKKYYKGK